MRKSFSFLKPVLFLFFIILLAIACNNETTAPTKTETPAEAVNPAPTTPAVTDATLTGYLDTLFVDSAQFELLGVGALGNWTIFRFSIDAANNLTMLGWSANNANGRFHGTGAPPPPNITLLVSGPSPIQLSPGNILGNLILNPTALGIIKNKLRSTHSKSVLFCPTPAGGNYNQVTYTISVSDKTNAKGLFTRVDPTGQSLYPSPPRNSQ